MQTFLDTRDLDPSLVVDCSRFQAQSPVKARRSQLLRKASKIDLPLTWMEIAFLFLWIMIFQVYMTHQPYLPEPGGGKNSVELVMEGKKFRVQRHTRASIMLKGSLDVGERIGVCARNGLDGKLQPMLIRDIQATS